MSEVTGDGSCEALDFLFVIDSSSTMSEHQNKLQASFGPFIDLLECTFDTVETLYIGVMTADDYMYNASGCQLLGNLVTETDGGSISKGPGMTQPPVQTEGGFRPSQGYERLEAGLPRGQERGRVGDRRGGFCAL